MNSSQTIDIFYSRKRIIRKIFLGILLIFIGIASVYFSIDSEDKLPSNIENFGVLILSAVKLGITAGPILVGIMLIASNFLTLISKSPMISINTDGLLLAQYKGWGLIKWNDIIDVKEDVKPTVGGFSRENCLVIQLTEEMAEKCFSREALIKIDLLDYDSEELRIRLIELLEKNHHS